VHLVLLLLSFAQASPPAALVALPTELEVRIVRQPGELQVWVSSPAPGLLRLTRTDDRPADATPTCSGGGVDLFAPDHAEAPWISEVCAGLTTHPPALPPGPRHAAGTEEQPRRTWSAQGVEVSPAILDSEGRLRPAMWPWRPLHAIVLPWLLLVLWALPRRREPWLIAAAALLIRLILTPDRALMGADAPFERYVTATGLAADPSPYGGTWAAMLGPVWLVLGRPRELAHLAGLVSSALSVAVLWELVARWFDERAARAAALILMAMPLAVALARTEDSLPLAALLQATAMLGLARRDPAGGALTAMSCVLLASLRPLQIPFALLLLAPLAAERAHRVAAVFAGALVLGEGAIAAWHAAQGIGVSDGLHLDALPRLLERGYIVGPGGRLAPADPAITPIGVTALAITSLLWVPGPYRRAMALCWSALAISTLPWLHIPDASVAARFQLPAQTWVAALAGIAWACVDERARRPWIAAIVLSWVLARAPLSGGHFPWTLEHNALHEALPYLPEDAVVRFRPVRPGSPWQPRYYQLLQQGVWVGLDRRPLEAGEYRWLGLSDAGAPADSCRLKPVWETMAPLPPELPVEGGLTEAAIGLYEVVTCEVEAQLPPLVTAADKGTQTLVPTPP
jgi:hypothetical protein